MCKGAPWVDFELGIKPDVLYRAMRYCAACPVRRDCVVDAINRKDVGMIRGGIQMRDKMKRANCRRCQLPVSEAGKLCTFCAMLRTCETCGITFPAKHPWFVTKTCPECVKVARMLAPRKFRFKKKPAVKQRVFRFRRLR